MSGSSGPVEPPEFAAGPHDRDDEGVETGGRRDRLADVSRRALAKAADWLVYFFLGTILTLPFVEVGPDGEITPNRWANLLWIVVIAAIETLGVGLWGQTLGKLALKIRVVSTNTGAPPGLLFAFLRVAPVITLLAVVPFPYYLAVIASLHLTAINEHMRRSILDRFARTVVVVA